VLREAPAAAAVNRSGGLIAEQVSGTGSARKRVANILGVDKLLSDFSKCAICLQDPMISPIYQCADGGGLHNVCTYCYDKLDAPKICPMKCGNTFTGTQNRMLSQMIAKQFGTQPCSNCGSMLKYEELKEHMGTCKHRPFKCPLCPDLIKKNEVSSHLRERCAKLGRTIRTFIQMTTELVPVDYSLTEMMPRLRALFPYRDDAWLHNLTNPEIILNGRAERATNSELYGMQRALVDVVKFDDDFVCIKFFLAVHDLYRYHLLYYSVSAFNASVDLQLSIVAKFDSRAITFEHNLTAQHTDRCYWNIADVLPHDMVLSRDVPITEGNFIRISRKPPP